MRPMLAMRPLPFRHETVQARPIAHLGPSDHPLTSAGGGYPGPLIRTPGFGFLPGKLPPVNLVRGMPRLYGAG